MPFMSWATTPGFSHVNPGNPGKINNQDAIAFKYLSHGFVAVICDGCSSTPFGGTGADIGANVIASIVKDQVGLHGKIDWDQVTLDTKAEISRQAKICAMSDDSLHDFEQSINDRFLFTVMVVIVNDDEVTIANFGDGIVVIDDELIDIEPPILNSPPYFGYLLLSESQYHGPDLQKHLAFSEIRKFNLSSLEKGFIVGTDGIRPLNMDDLHHPALVQGATLQQWLNTQTTEQIGKNNEGTATLINGKCSDDATLLIVRSDAAQQRLFDNRVLISELKKMVLDLEREFKAYSSKRGWAVSCRDLLEKEIDDLETRLQEVVAKDKSLNLFESTIKKFTAQIAKMRQSLPPVYVPHTIVTSVNVNRTTAYQYGHPQYGGNSVNVSFPSKYNPAHRVYRYDTLKETEDEPVQGVFTMVSQAVGRFLGVNEEDSIVNEPPKYRRRRHGKQGK